MRLAMITVLAAGALAVVLVAGCRKENQAQNPNTQQYPPQQYPPQPPPQGTYPAYSTPPQAYPPATGAAAPPPAGGLPCQTDNDPQCPFGHCISGTCGACSMPEHCKPGATCMQTLFGGKCFPGGAPPAR
jgi:hypothetical protein